MHLQVELIQKILKINIIKFLFEKMTLYINVTQAANLPQGGYLIVEGSRAGLLASKQIGSSQRFSPPFLIKAASDDILTFKLCPSYKGYENGEVLSYGTLHGPVLTKRYRNQLATYNPSASQIQASHLSQEQAARNSQIRSSGIRNSSSSGALGYDVELTDRNSKNAGVLHTTITYDKVSHFQGEFCTAAQREAAKIGQKVGMFKGKCPTKNLFSLIDPACEGQHFKFIESIYKDGPEEYRVL